MKIPSFSETVLNNYLLSRVDLGRLNPFSWKGHETALRLAEKAAAKLESNPDTRRALKKTGVDFGFDPMRASERQVDRFVDGVRRELREARLGMPPPSKWK